MHIRIPLFVLQTGTFLSQQPKDSNSTINNNHSKNKQYNRMGRNRNRLVYISYVHDIYNRDSVIRTVWQCVVINK